MMKPYRQAKSTSLRHHLWHRTGPFCFYCGRETTKPQRYWEIKHPLMPTADHKTPRSRGGEDGGRNMVVACRDCNELKGQLTAEEFEAAVFWGVERDLELPPRRPGKHVVPLTSIAAWREFFNARDWRRSRMENEPAREGLSGAL